MKIAVIGANGQLGNDVVAAFRKATGTKSSPSPMPTSSLSNIDSVSNCLQGLRPQVVVNTAAMHHVENCEREPEKAFAVNGAGHAKPGSGHRVTLAQL